ncbi:esterase/lipase family protein [Mycobacterium syngnathidarum]
MAPDNVVPPLNPPPALWTATEGWRAVAELLSLYPARRCLDSLPDGDGAPVLVLPGLAVGDITTVPLRRVLARHGYAPYSWGLGANMGPTRRVIDGLDALLDQVVSEHGRMVSIVGWSLGGLLGRDLAVRHPDAVCRLITMGTPLGITHHRQTRAGFVYDWCSRFHLPEYAFDTWKRQQVPETLPTTSIYSRSDGISRWESCLLPTGPRWENVEVIGSHNGFGFNPLALRVVLDRLALPAGEWAPFRGPRRLRRYYPRPATAA